MYCGVKLDVSVNDYASARAALENRCAKSRGHRDDAYPGGGWVPLGHKRSQVTSIRMHRDESIACRLYSTDVVTWYPDNSVSVISHPTVTTSAFANALLPSGLNLGGESELMTFFPGCGSNAGWSERWQSARVCNGTGTYRNVDGVWVPDEDTITPLTHLTLDKSISRQVCKEYPFAQFKTWLFVACGVMDIEHQGEDLDKCAEALRARNFRQAAEHLPTVNVPRGFGIRERLKPLRMSNVRYGAPVTLGSIDYVRRWLYADAGAYTETEVTTMSSTQYEQQRKLCNQLRNVGSYI